MTKIIPPLYFAFISSTAIVAEGMSNGVPLLEGAPAQKTATGALIVISTSLVMALVWVVKRQFEVNAAQGEAFAKMQAQQQKVFTEACERMRADHQQTMERIAGIWAKATEHADKE